MERTSVEFCPGSWHGSFCKHATNETLDKKKIIIIECKFLFNHLSQSAGMADTRQWYLAGGFLFKKKARKEEK